MIELSLPFPPSVNTYWRRAGHRIYLSQRGQMFRKHVGAIAALQKIEPVSGPLALFVDLYPRTRRVFDTDNFLKATLDALEHAGVYENDSQVKRIEAEKHAPVTGGRTDVRILTYDEYLRQQERENELVCCAGCGRDTPAVPQPIVDSYCDRCIGHGETHAFPEELDRKPLGKPEWFGGHIQHDLEMGDDFAE